MLETWLAFKALPWKLIGYCALGMALVLMYAALRIEQAQNVKLKAQLHAQIEAGKAKKSEVRDVIKQGKDRIVVVEKQAKRIEGAPIPGNCQTPDAVMGADL